MALVAVTGTAVGALLAHERGVAFRAWAESNIAGAAVTALGAAAAAAVVLRQGPRNRLGWIFLGVALLEASTVLGTEWVLGPGAGSPGRVIVAWVAANTWWLGLLLLTFVPLLFPSGRLASARWRPVAAIAVLSVTVGGVVGIGSGLLVEDAFPGLGGPVPGRMAPAAFAAAAGSAVLLALACAAAAMVALVLRLRTTGDPERGQISWFLVGCLALVVFDHLPGQPWTGLVGDAAFPLTLAVAMVRYDLFAGERLLSRVIVYALMTGAVLGLVGVGAAALGTGVAGSIGGIMVASLLVAIGLEPVRRRVQAVVDGMLFGAPRDPYLALRSAGDELARAAEDPLGAVTRSLVRSLHVRSAELLTAEEAAIPGGPGTVDETLRLGGEQVAVLRVRLREGRSRLDPADERLLQDLLPQVTAAARTGALLEEAVTARATLLLAVEEERRRLRRDLHDGVGPTLAGLGLGLAALEAALEQGRPAPEDLVERLARQARGCLEEVHGVVEQLRPSALDGLGLTGALREHAATLSARPGRVAVLLHAPLVDELPAAVELAAYRCLMEAMTNAVVHAGASRCDVNLRLEHRALCAEVVDDGIGLAASADTRRGTGTGLLSMTQRAAELGGRVEIESSPGGTRVCLRLPLDAASHTGVPR